MKTSLQFYNSKTKNPDICGEALEIMLSSAELNWEGVILEKGFSPHFYLQDVYTPYFYFALGIEQDLNWKARVSFAK